MSSRAIAVVLLTVAAILGGTLAAIDAVPGGVRPAPLTVGTTPTTPAATTPQAVIDRARALTDAGFADEGRGVLKTWIKEHPDFRVPADLRDSTVAPAPAKRILSAVLPWIVALGLAIAAALSAWWLARLVVEILWRAGRGVAAGMRRVAGQSPTTPLRLTSVDGGGLDEPARHALGSILLAHSRRLSERGGSGPRGVRVQRPLEQGTFKLPDELVAVYAPAGVLASIVALVVRLAPDPGRPVTLELLPADPVNGLGVEARLGDKTQTIRERPFGLLPQGLAPTSEDRKASRYQSLMLPAAVWLADAAAGPEQTSGLGVRNWRSYAHAAIGATFHVRGDLAAAERRYREALAGDPENAMARYNLGSLLLQPRAGERPMDLLAATDRLELVQALFAPLADRVGADPEARPALIDVSAAYLDGIRCLYAHDLKAAAHRLGVVAGALAVDQSKPGGRGDAEGHSDTLDAVRRGLAVTVPLLQETVKMLNTELIVEPPQIGAGAWIPDVHYAYACFYSRRAQISPAEASPDRVEAFGHLRAALGTGDELLRRCAQTDPAFEPLRTGDDAEAFSRLVRDPEAQPKGPDRKVAFSAADGPVTFTLED